MKYERVGPLMCPETEDLLALEDVFIAWAKNHGVVWFDHDVALAEAIAGVLRTEIDWDAQ